MEDFDYDDDKNEIVALYAFVDELKDALSLKDLETGSLSEEVVGLRKRVATLSQQGNEKQSIIFGLEENMR